MRDWIIDHCAGLIGVVVTIALLSFVVWAIRDHQADPLTRHIDIYKRHHAGLHEVGVKHTHDFEEQWPKLP